MPLDFEQQRQRRDQLIGIVRRGSAAADNLDPQTRTNDIMIQYRQSTLPVMRPRHSV